MAFGAQGNIFQNARVFIGRAGAPQRRKVRRANSQRPRCRSTRYTLWNIDVLRRNVRPARWDGHKLFRIRWACKTLQVEVRIEIAPHWEVGVIHTDLKWLPGGVQKESGQGPSADDPVHHVALTGQPALSFPKRQLVTDKSLHNVRLIVIGECMRCRTDVVEILNGRVIAVPFLLSRKSISFLPGKRVTHIHGQAASGALDYVDDHGVVVALT